MKLTEKIARILIKYRIGVIWLYNDDVPTPKAGESLSHQEAIEAILDAVKEYNKEVVGEDESAGTSALSNSDRRRRAKNKLRSEIRQRQEELL